MDLDGKVSIVTGGSRGIGKAICKKLAEEGSSVVMISRNPQTAAAALAEFKENNFKVTNFVADVSQLEEVDLVVKTVIRDFGKIDILVNNAGIAKDNLVLRMKNEEWDEVMAINLKGTFNCVKSVSRYMVKKRYGKIVNISSVVGLSGNIGQGNYSAAKAGIIGFTKTVAREFASRNITINAVAPGYIETDMTDNLLSGAKASFLENIPLKRSGTPKDVANLVHFLVSDEASYITGQTVNVDGGMVM